MTITQKIEHSKDTTCFTLYREGLFYKCYNEDAMVFTQRVRAYKVSSKFVKSVEAEVLSLGFPVSEVEKGNLSLASVSEKIGAKSFEESDGNIIFSLNDIVIKKDYETWKNTIQEGIIEVVKEPATLYQRPPDISEIISMIKNYDLANSTPMQGLSFIQQLKSVALRCTAMHSVVLSLPKQACRSELVEMKIPKVEQSNGNI